MKTPIRDVIQIVKPSSMATILFCDVRGFAQLASGVPVEQLVGRLSSHLSLVTDTLKENRGTVAKFVGDAVLAYWLADEQPDHAALACRFTSSLHEKLLTRSNGMTTSIGIHTGSTPLVTYNYGNNRSLEPLGDTVNLAIRLAPLCSQYEAKAIATGAVISAGGNSNEWTLLDTAVVKGRSQPVTLYGLKT